MKVVRNARAAALFSGVLGAFLESSTRDFDQGHDTALLTRCREWLIQNNPIYRRYEVRAELQIHPIPTVVLPAGSLENVPYARPELIMDPLDYPSMCANESARYFRLPEATLQDRDGSKLVMNRSNPLLEPLLFPVLYPWGKGHWVRPSAGERRLFHDTLGRAAKRRLNFAISHFRDDHYWSTWTYMEVEAVRIFQNTQRLVTGQTKRTLDGRLTCNELLRKSEYGAWSIVNEALTTTIPQFIRTGDTFFIQAESRIKAMMSTYQIPSLFVTVTFSERWPKYVEILAQTGNHDTLPSNRPWEAVQYYFERWHWLKAEFFRKPRISRFGKLRELVERQEFQQRGAIHTHSLLWVERDIGDLIKEEYIRADLPDPLVEPRLYELVKQHQLHTCKPSLCGGPVAAPGQCRKGFPARLADKTERRGNELRYTYKRVRLQDCWVVRYNPRLLEVWKAHCNVQYCTSGGLAKYISKYVSKVEPKSVVNLRSDNAVQEHLLARHMSAMEVMVLLLSFPIFRKSSSCIYLPTSMPTMRSSTVKPAWLMLGGDEDPYFQDALEKYFVRPPGAPFDHLTYFKYHAEYLVSYSRQRSSREVWQDGNGYFVY
jgi:hypothetical protein